MTEINKMATGQISIHALLAESDHYGWSWYDDFTISIHALLAESDLQPQNSTWPTSKFLSTLSLRRATANNYGETKIDKISIHALLAESDPTPRCRPHLRAPFLSTLSLRRATQVCKVISPELYFYPRSPCGERHPAIAVSSGVWTFLSTLSLRRATAKQLGLGACQAISIHALLAESDIYPSQWRTLARDFYPRSPCGERPFRSPRITLMAGFLSTLSLRRATAAGVYLVTLII